MEQKKFIILALALVVVLVLGGRGLQASGAAGRPFRHAGRHTKHFRQRRLFHSITARAGFHRV